MANIETELNKIKNAVYGKDVRGSIHDGIDKINKEVETVTEKAEQAHDVMTDIINEGFDNAALEANFEQKLNNKIENLQPEWTQFKEDTEDNFANVTSQLADIVNDSFREKGVMFAHRGFRNLAPESTIPAFELAGKYGFFGIETDVRASADGDLYCYHDNELSNYTDGVGRVEDNDSNYLNALTFTKGSNIDKYPNTKLCTFEEYVQIANKYNMYIIPEVNSTRSIDKVVEILTKHNYWDKTILQSTNKTVHSLIRNINKNVPLVYTTFREVDESDLDYCVTIKPVFMGVGVNGGYLQDGYIELAHNKGVGICAYTINDYNVYFDLLESGADIIMSDHIVGGVSNV